jgi:hypothetical protein
VLWGRTRLVETVEVATGKFAGRSPDHGHSQPEPDNAFADLPGDLGWVATLRNEIRRARWSRKKPPSNRHP